MRHSRTAALAAFILLLSATTAVTASAQGWLELPGGGFRSGLVRSTQYMEQGGRTVRSHTFCYDPSLRISRWVAYPLNKGLIGEGSRGDGWHPYAGIPESSQSVLYKGFRYGSGYDRGHQIPSADRLDKDINRETFVFANATPQRHSFNEGLWADLEKLVRTWAKRSDTLYVVTGAVPGKESVTDNAGNPVNIPSAYYKAVLRRNTDRYGRVRWTACAVCVPHETDRPEGMNWPETLRYLEGFSCSVRELESITGDRYFVNLEGALGKKAAEEILCGDPRKEAWWWK